MLVTARHADRRSALRVRHARVKPSLDRMESPRPEVDESCAAGSGSNDEIPLPLSEAEVDKWFAEFHATRGA